VPTVETVNMTVQKNKVGADNSTIFILKTATEINQLFNSSDGVCDVKGWYLSTAGKSTPLDKKDAVSIRMQQTERNVESPDRVNMLIDTHFEERRELIFSFVLHSKDIVYTADYKKY
jgi:hypothetical protein